jgi:hypothetical protein
MGESALMAIRLEFQRDNSCRRHYVFLNLCIAFQMGSATSHPMFDDPDPTPTPKACSARAGSAVRPNGIRDLGATELNLDRQ